MPYLRFTPHGVVPRSLAGLVVAFLLSVPLAAACDDGTGGEGDPAAPTLNDATAVPTATLPPASPIPGDTEAPGAGDIPATPEDYALAAFDAWLAGETASLETLVAPDVLVVLEEHPVTDPDGWANAGCDAATGQLSCAFESDSGEVLVMLVDLQAASAGRPGAVVEAQLA